MSTCFTNLSFSLGKKAGRLFAERSLRACHMLIDFPSGLVQRATHSLGSLGNLPAINLQAGFHRAASC